MRPRISSRRTEMSALRADGTEFPVELAVTPFKADDSWIFTAHIRDITERKEAEEELRARPFRLQIVTTAGNQGRGSHRPAHIPGPSAAASGRTKP